MPSLRTRMQYDRLVLETAEQAIAGASEALADATETIDASSADLQALASGNFDVDAITINGQRFINNGGILEPE